MEWTKERIHQAVENQREFFLSGETLPVSGRIETLKKLLTPMGITLSEFFNEDGEVAVLNDREKEIVTSFRTMNDENASLYLQLGKALSKS